MEKELLKDRRDTQESTDSTIIPTFQGPAAVVDIGAEMLSNSAMLSPYKAFLEVRRAIDEHKWLLSEKAGHDVGFETGLVSFVQNHRRDFLADLRKQGKLP